MPTAKKEGWKAINVWLSPAELAKLEELRKAMDRNHYTEVIRRLIREAPIPNAGGA